MKLNKTINTKIWNLKELTFLVNSFIILSFAI